MKRAYQYMEDMKDRRILLHPYIDAQVLEDVHEAVGVPLNDDEEAKDGSEDELDDEIEEEVEEVGHSYNCDVLFFISDIALITCRMLMKRNPDLLALETEVEIAAASFASRSSLILLRT